MNIVVIRLSLLFIFVTSIVPSLYADSTLTCGAFDIQLQGGIVPILWQDRGSISGVNCPPLPDSGPLNTVLTIPQFHKFFHIPWTIGVQCGYAYSNNMRWYVEFNYVQAHAKSPRSTRFSIPPLPGVPPGVVLNFVISNYKLCDYYLGARYYFDSCWCNRMSFFIGAKVGCVQHQKTDFTLSETIPSPDGGFNLVLIPSKMAFFKKKISVGGGLNVGVDICFTKNLSLAITGEFVASCGPKINNVVFLMPNFPISATNILLGGVGTELRFPVTAALRYSF